MPTRLPLLVVIAAGFAGALTPGETPAQEEGGWRKFVLYVSGFAFVVVVVGWRWFWHGRAVCQRLDRRQER